MNQSNTHVNSLKERLEKSDDYYEIRLESIGGLGANLCGKMLGELGVKYLDVNSSSFSSYGSEKTGTPVKGYIRYCRKDKEIRVHYPVVTPDLLVVFHQALLKDNTVWKGCNNGTTVIIAVEPGENQVQIPDYKEEEIGMPEAVYVLEAQRIAMETHSRINVVMLGAILRIMGLNDMKAGEGICKDTIGRKYPDALNNNILGMQRGYKEVRKIELHKINIEKNGKVDSSPVWGYDNAPVGGINPRIGSTVVADLSPSRQGYIPLFIKERCINCGLCHSTCPDMVFQFEKGQYKGRNMMVNQGLDYYHCKGCLRCVDVCPVNALVRAVEAEQSRIEHLMPNKELLRKPYYYEKSGADGYITSESYLTEKRMEGGEV